MPRELYKKLALVLLSTLFSLFVAELSIRLLISNPQFLDRYVMWNSPLFVLESDGAVRHMESQSLREIAVYDGEIEYDVRLSTNSLGMVDDEEPPRLLPLQAGERRIAFVGDSFAVGAGGKMWVPELRRRVAATEPNVHIYNLGLIGAGFELFLKILGHYAKQIEFSELLVLAISDDFNRGEWYPIHNQTEIRLCHASEDPDVCRQRFPMFFIVPTGISQEALLERIQSYAVLREKYTPSGASYLTRLVYAGGEYSRVLNLLARYLDKQPLFALGEMKQELGGGLLHYLQRQNLKALQHLREEYSDLPIRLVHLPQREEVRSGEYFFNPSAEVRRMGIEYFPALHECRWSVEMYHPHDEHPNSRGYDAIGECVEKYLFQ